MPSKTVCCRLCLAMDVPMHILENGPLQEVYEKLTNISLNKVRWPVVSCYLCYCQLRKCHNLMVRSVRADRVLNQILQSGDVIRKESIAKINREAHQLNHIMVVTPVEFMDVSNTDDNSIIEEIKSEPDEERVVTPCEPLFDELNYEEDTEITTEDTDVKMEFIIERDIKTDVLDDVDVATKQLMDEKYTRQEESEAVQVTEYYQIQGADLKREYRTRMKSRNMQYSDKKILRSGSLKIRDQMTYSKNEISPHIKNTANKKQISKNISLKTARNKRNVFKSDNNCISANTDNINKESDQKRRSDNKNSSKDWAETFICNDCGEIFWDKYLLIEHIKNNGIKKESYQVCTEGDAQQGIELHLEFSETRTVKKQKGIDTRRRFFKCKICKKTLYSKNNLSEHVRVHTGEKPYQCEICHHRFRQRNTFKRHKRLHTGERPYQCKTCQQRFTTTTGLSNHLVIHTGEKKYACKICPKRFKSNSNLYRHKNIHTGEKSFECVICQKRLTTKFNLTQHLRIHTGEKPFKCDICLRRFNQKGILTQHVARHARPGASEKRHAK